MRDSLGGCAPTKRTSLRHYVWLAFLIAGAVPAYSQASSIGWMPVRFIHTRPPTDPQAWNPDTLVFRNGHRLTARLWSVSYLGQLPRGDRPPYLVLAAMGCYD